MEANYKNNNNKTPKTTTTKNNLKNFKWNYPTYVDSVTPRINKNEILVRELLEVYKTIQNIAIVLDYPPLLNTVTLLLKTLYALAAEYREMKFKLSR